MLAFPAAHVLTRKPPLQIAVCDDEPMDRRQAADLTREIMASEGLACDLSACESAAALLDAIRGGAQFTVQNHIQHLISALYHRADFFVLSHQIIQIRRLFKRNSARSSVPAV